MESRINLNKSLPVIFAPVGYNNKNMGCCPWSDNKNTVKSH